MITAQTDDPRPERVRVRVLVSGRVQRVLYRVSCEREASRLGIDGSVRNLADGRVEAVFEGAPDLVEAAVAWCRIGPPHARVDSVEVLPEDPTDERGFQILA